MDEAIAAYTKAIDLVEDHIIYSNRSAAHLKKGATTNALADANSCLELNPDYAKGYSRKGAALHYLKDYDNAIAALEAGLSKFPENADLAREVTKVLMAKNYTSENQQQVRQSMAAKRASVSMLSKAGEAANLSDFVVASKMSLELEISALQAQLALINALSAKTDHEKLVMLFGLIDKDYDGCVDAVELADALRKRNADLAFADSIERAISFVAAFDNNHDAKLDLVEFKSFLDAILGEMGGTFHELAEFLILQILFSETGNDEKEAMAVAMISDEINEAVLEKEEFFDALTDPRMQTLFGLFDMDGNGSVDFKEVAVGLFQLTDDMEAAASTAVTVLLMLDEEDKRTLNFEQFAKLMLHVVTAAGKKFVDMADKMTLALISTRSVSQEDISKLVFGEALYNLVKDEKEEHRELLETMDAFQYGRIQRLFQLWDSDNDGEISLPELLTGMNKFKTAIEMDESVSRAALAVIGFDDDDPDQTLSPLEFAVGLANYAAATEVDIHDLVDFLVMAAVLEDDSPEEQAYMRGISNQVNAEIKLGRENLVDHDIE